MTESIPFTIALPPHYMEGGAASVSKLDTLNPTYSIEATDKAESIEEQTFEHYFLAESQQDSGVQLAKRTPSEAQSFLVKSEVKSLESNADQSAPEATPDATVVKQRETDAPASLIRPGQTPHLSTDVPTQIVALTQISKEALTLPSPSVEALANKLKRENSPNPSLVKWADISEAIPPQPPLEKGAVTLQANSKLRILEQGNTKKSNSFQKVEGSPPEPLTALSYSPASSVRRLETDHSQIMPAQLSDKASPANNPFSGRSANFDHEQLSKTNNDRKKSNQNIHLQVSAQHNSALSLSKIAPRSTFHHDLASLPGDKTTISGIETLPFAQVSLHSETSEPNIANNAVQMRALGGLTPPRVSMSVQVTKTDSIFEVSLKPEELGRLSLKLEPTANGTQVIVFTDKPETLELARRHADALEQQMKELGFNNLSFTFEGGNEGRRAKEQEPHGHAEDSHSISPSVKDGWTVSTVTGLDIRI